MPAPLRQPKKQPRRNRLTVMLNDSEKRALERYCRRYGISNRSAAVRQLLIGNLLRRLDTDSPTLFD